MTNTIVKLTLSRAFVILVFPVLVLLPIVLNTVGEINSLPMTLATCGVTAALGLVMGAGLLFLKKMSGNFWFKLLFILGIFGLICVYLDVLLFSYRSNFDGIGDLFGFVDGARPVGGLVMLGITALVLGAALIGFVWYTKIYRIIWRNDDQIVDAFAILFAVSALSAILFSNYGASDDPTTSVEQATASEDLSITIVIDAMIGSAGLRTDIPENIALADEIDAFYRHYDFLHFPKAFSRHFYTIQSIPSSLNGLSTGVPDLTEVSTTTGYHNRLKKNKLFDGFQARQLPVHVYQTQFVDVCGHEAVVTCNYLNTADRLSPHIPSEFQVNSKFFLGLYMFDYTFKKSYVTKRIVKALFQPAYAALQNQAPQQYNLLFGFIMNVDITFDSLFDQFAADITSGQGRAYYGHFMPTHYPFRLNTKCAPMSDKFSHGGKLAFSRLVETHGISPDQATGKREALYAAYRNQVRCTHLKLAALFDELKRQGRFESATITLLGDHGSRIANGYSNTGASERDLIDNHSTLFAIKRAGGSAKSDPRMISVQQLLMAQQSPDSADIPGEIEKTVVLRTSEGDAKILVDMPDF